VGVTRVEDKSLPTEDKQKKENKNSTPASPSPRIILESVLDAEHAEAVMEHRQRSKAGFTKRAAQLLAKQFALCPDPNAAADTMIARGWRGFEAKWLTDPQARAGPVRHVKQSPLDHFKNYASEINGKAGDDGGDRRDWDDAPGIPLRTIEHHG
jgi:hypothetical protein